MKQRLLFVIVLIQILAIVILVLQLQKKVGNILSTSINPIKSNNIDRVLGSNLKYFYEPRTNTTEEERKDWLNYVPRYTLNKDSLNERFNYEIESKQGVYRIITLGNSFTFGQNVSTERNWTELLEDYLNSHLTCGRVRKYEVINLGVYAYDMQYEVERYKIRGGKYNPDIVVWMFTDYERIIEQMMSLIKENETAENKELENKGIFYHNWQVAREDMLQKIGQKGLIDYQKKQVKRLDEFHRGKLLFVTMPNKPEYTSILQQRTKERADSYFFQPNIQWKQTGLFLPDDHFNDAGNKKMMEEIAGYLVKNKLIPCTQ